MPSVTACILDHTHVTKVPDGEQLPAKAYDLKVAAADTSVSIITQRPNYPKADRHAKASVGLIGLAATLLGGFGVNFKRKHS